jgi:hypothetical protein
LLCQDKIFGDTQLCFIHFGGLATGPSAEFGTIANRDSRKEERRAAYTTLIYDRGGAEMKAYRRFTLLIP